MKDRIMHLPTTLLGIAGAGVVIVSQAAGCGTSLTDWKVWGPAAMLAAWGAYLKPQAPQA